MALILDVARDAGGSKIEAIKFIRSVTGMGLKDSKTFTEKGDTDVHQSYQWFEVRFNSDSVALQFMLSYRDHNFAIRGAEYISPESTSAWLI